MKNLLLSVAQIIQNRQRVVFIGSILACLSLAGITFATVGANPLRQAGVSTPAQTEVPSSTAGSITPTIKPTSSINAASETPASQNRDTGATQNGVKQLIVSANTITVGTTGHSKILIARSPDGFELCSIASDFSATGPAAVRPDGAGCSKDLQFMFSTPRQAGTYRVRVFADTTEKVLGGKYVRYETYITVVAESGSSNPMFSIGTINFTPIPKTEDGKVQSFPVYINLLAEPGHAGFPQMTYQFSRPGACQTVQAAYNSAFLYNFRCFPVNQDHDSFTITFRAFDGKSEQVKTISIQY